MIHESNIHQTDVSGLNRLRYKKYQELVLRVLYLHLLCLFFSFNMILKSSAGAMIERNDEQTTTLTNTFTVLNEYPSKRIIRNSS